jgi:hypothetical protein
MLEGLGIIGTTHEIATGINARLLSSVVFATTITTITITITKIYRLVVMRGISKHRQSEGKLTRRQRMGNVRGIAQADCPIGESIRTVHIHNRVNTGARRPLTLPSLAVVKLIPSLIVRVKGCRRVVPTHCGIVLGWFSKTQTSNPWFFFHACPPGVHDGNKPVRGRTTNDPTAIPRDVEF